MKLMNKNTGDVSEKIEVRFYDSRTKEKVWVQYDSIAELSKDWEDYEELEKAETWDCDDVLQLKCGLTIALEDYYELDADGNKKGEFTLDEALEIEKKTGGKWRVPTQYEWMMVLLELGYSDKKELNPKLFLDSLHAGSYGRWWSSTSHSSLTNYAWDLNANTSSVYPADYNYRYYGNSVRCVRGELWGGEE